ncbi:hypothetical protein SSBR45G_42020 [Bradyrhizobium sp. SSBR45G]|uniref:hypothetical protein n=1 Tax=unclassified Bradyrhizobium TaxID=2631580 RepID=UPI002342A13E|nr:MULTISPECIES: hypothetical protein [unclassified Bradyrhizobium]GLH79293.1 hypothetical protein SSBR45G_42020 [Bradyrhizobium sp. SSBR45G]GLH86771.1 hypothetical protein SSBR45R_42310 [Bradyrhizobium sp. SSBR45R]
MNKLIVAMTVALLAGWAVPAMAQMPNINLLADGPSKTPEEKEAEAAREKAYKETIRKIPDAKTSADPWGNVRTVEQPKATPPVKTTAAKKPKSGASTN